jgi:NADPH:quinone reductase-like Zn-dependent oxidoreductase
MTNSSGMGPNGSFAEYLVSSAHTLIKLPEDYPFENAAQLGASTFTAFQTLWQSQKDRLPKISLNSATSANLESELITLLVWSGASSIGHYVIQFAKMAGMKVITTASPKHFDRLQKIGADQCFDYNEPDVGAKIRAATRNKLKHVVDCISDKSTFGKVSDSLSEEGGHISGVLRYETDLREGVTANVLSAYDFLGEASSFLYHFVSILLC